MKYGIIMLVAFIVTVSVPAQTQTTDTTAAASHSLSFDPTRDPAQDLRQAVAEATGNGKRILLDVGGNWCKWCKMLDKFFETDTAAAQSLHGTFVVVKVNFSKENENTAFLSTYPKIPGYPHFFILDSDGTFLHSQDTGVLEKGQGYDAGKIMTFINKWTKQRSE
jgi:thiol:disulfide interchange protein